MTRSPYWLNDETGKVVIQPMPDAKVVFDPHAKLGHHSPCCGEQLFQGDHGLTCPKCNTAYVTEKSKAAKGKE